MSLSIFKHLHSVSEADRKKKMKSVVFFEELITRLNFGTFHFCFFDSDKFTTAFLVLHLSSHKGPAMLHDTFCIEGIVQDH